MVMFKGINEFNLMISYKNEYPQYIDAESESHIHSGCEIYINLSGDVSFAVEDKIYPIASGDIIITRPYEYHHCIYHSNMKHKHFWILFSSQGNEEFLDLFYNRKCGENNLLSLPSENFDELVSLCHKIYLQKDSPGNHYEFFKLIHLLQSAESRSISDKLYPEDIIYAFKYINNNFTQKISVQDIAKGAHVSVNTLERHFNDFFNISPYSYIQKKRLANGAKLLSEGYSVTEVSERCGFSDYSYFISLFKKTYGITPYKYKLGQK